MNNIKTATNYYHGNALFYEVSYYGDMINHGTPIDSHFMDPHKLYMCISSGTSFLVYRDYGDIWITEDPLDDRVKELVARLMSGGCMDYSKIIALVEL